jgi:hypothetical protein
MYRAGSLGAVGEEISKYKLDSYCFIFLMNILVLDGAKVCNL